MSGPGSASISTPPGRSGTGTEPRMAPRPLAAGDAPWALALNAAFVEMLSPLTPARLEALRRAAWRATAFGTQAFLLAFDERAAYDSPNFLWFRARYPRFVYIDRVVVAPAARRAGCARALYADLIACAQASGRDLIACEVNLDPPNPASDAFHDSLGFVAVGEAGVGAKRVRYMARDGRPAA